MTGSHDKITGADDKITAADEELPEADDEATEADECKVSTVVVLAFLAEKYLQNFEVSDIFAAFFKPSLMDIVFL